MGKHTDKVRFVNDFMKKCAECDMTVEQANEHAKQKLAQFREIKNLFNKYAQQKLGDGAISTAIDTGSELAKGLMTLGFVGLPVVGNLAGNVIGDMAASGYSHTYPTTQELQNREMSSMLTREIKKIEQRVADKKRRMEAEQKLRDSYRRQLY